MIHPKRALPIIVVAIVLSLGMATSALAQSSSESSEVSVTLTSDVCAVDISTTGSFGVWKWTGTTYEEQTGFTTTHVTSTLSNQPVDGCDLSVSFTGLSLEGHVIPADWFWTVAGLDSSYRAGSGWTDTGITSDTYHAAFMLVSVPDDMPVGTYTGTITVSVVNTQ